MDIGHVCATPFHPLKLLKMAKIAKNNKSLNDFYFGLVRNKHEVTRLSRHENVVSTLCQTQTLAENGQSGPKMTNKAKHALKWQP